jgi:hypothetical protein
MINKIKLIGILYSVFILTLFAFREKQKCGVGKTSNGKVEFHICEDMFNLNQDSINNSEDEGFKIYNFDEVSEQFEYEFEYENVPFLEKLTIVGDFWITEYDTIAFYLPNGFSIIEAKQSFEIKPSIWANMEDNVVQYRDFNDLKKFCKDPQVLKLKNNMLLNPLNIDYKYEAELYFKNKNGLSKNELLTSLIRQFDSEDLYIKSSETYSVSEKKESLLENQREREIYIGYLKNYINYGNGNDIVGLLSEDRYLTLTIQNGKNLYRLLFLSHIIYGN